jgi:hypothetical protein
MAGIVMWEEKALKTREVLEEQKFDEEENWRKFRLDLELEDGLQEFSWEQKTERNDGKRITTWNYYTIKAYLSGRLQKEKWVWRSCLMYFWRNSHPLKDPKRMLSKLLLILSASWACA